MATYSTLLTATKELCSIASSNTTFNTFLKRVINDGQQDFANETNWKYLEAKGSTASSTFKFQYTLPSDFDIVKSVVWEHDHYLRPINTDQWVRLTLNDSIGTPRWYIIQGGSLRIWPKPNKSSLETDLIYGFSSSSNSIYVRSAAMEDKGRIQIGTEKIEYAHADGNTLRICTRGVEGTSPAAQTKGSTVTYQNIEFNYYKFLPDLSGDDDKSGLPTRYHRALPLYATAQYFYKTEDAKQGDKFMERYLFVRNQAKRDLGEKQSQTFKSTLDDDQNDTMGMLDNTYPERGSLEYL